MISDYTEAKQIAQDRANRGGILMYIFKIVNDGYYLTTQIEHPFVDRDTVESIEEVWPNVPGNDILY